ncbi:hypothetical protein [Erwinia tasmaniensis]|uniref:Rhs element Vgr protein n=1 Tax=Erwinia tasmaniensis (strain DSM 17950 / CFBP 7177 / CIP 109463 / NCPPB 4357 / Et1/99) TaxID=465817 RepID=B2VJE5_ERWT9|nr:hypothetical protein [Erwinia tasmaniensis]CAO95670.1 conserved hypothetical protein [Erwinia tasmaniensis Et1/99]
MKLTVGDVRGLTSGEISMAISVFGNAINYAFVKVHNDSYLPFNLQSNRVAMTPNGEIYFREPYYKDDFSIAPAGDKHWFIHEMVHVLQHQIGMNVRLRGTFSWAASYEYSLPPDKLLSDFGMEQQASIISDYYYVKSFGLNNFDRLSGFRGIVGPDLKLKYQNTLRVFLTNPRSRSAFL